MSIVRCASCEKDIDLDYNEEYNIEQYDSEPVCEFCWNKHGGNETL